MSEAVIKLENVNKTYGKNEVLKGVNMQVNKGDIYGLVGRNGAGKTTIFKMILGLSEVALSGEVVDWETGTNLVDYWPKNVE